MLNFDHPQSKLCFDFIKILDWIKQNNNKDVKFLLENVEMKNEWKDIITEYMQVEPLKINSNLLSAQNRPQIYWTNIEGVEIPKDNNVRLIDILEDIDTSNFIKYKGLLLDNKC